MSLRSASRLTGFSSFTADLAALFAIPENLTTSFVTALQVLKEDASGFELWIGSLEADGNFFSKSRVAEPNTQDALNLRALRDRGIDAVLNCAVRDCDSPPRSARFCRYQPFIESR